VETRRKAAAKGVLKRLHSHCYIDLGRDVRHLIDKVVVDSASKSSQKLKAALHSFQVQNELLHYENNGLRAALTVKKKHGKKNRPLDLQQRKEYHGGAVFWSPRKVKEAEARKVVKR
jgi:hypothetical protein